MRLTIVGWQVTHQMWVRTVNAGVAAVGRFIMVCMVCCVCVIPVFAQGTHAVTSLEQSKSQIALKTQRDTSVKVTLRVSDSTVRWVIHAIARQARLQPVFNEKSSQLNTRISVNISKADAMSALVTVLKGTGLEAKLGADGETVRIRPIPSGDAKNEEQEQQQSQGSIIGRVMDTARKAGIAGATVVVVGTKLSAVTNNEGGFRIDGVPTGAQSLTVKLLGYQSKTISVTVAQGLSQLMTISMSQASTTLSEVVTTVTGSQRKIEVGNDITTLDVPEIMKQAPITSVTDLLEARVPGLTVMRTSGVPGSPSRIRLRGIGGGLLSGTPGAPTNDPIVVVDGIRIYAGQSGVDDQKLGGGKYPTPSPIDQIDPNSIEKIEVLRGPSASAMYGSDAGDGVIVITTKKGKPGTTRWDVAGVAGIESMPGTYAMPGFYRFGHQPGGRNSNNLLKLDEMFCPPITDANGYVTCQLDSLVRFQALNEPRLSTIGRGTNTRLSGTASGGVSAFTYSVTGSIANTLGLTKMPPLYQDLFRELYDSAPSARMRRPNAMDNRSGQASFSAELSRGLRATFTTSLAQSVQYQSSANEQLSDLASRYMDTLNINPGRPGQYAYQLKTNGVTANHALALNLVRWNWLPMTATVGMNRVERSAEGLTPRGILTINEILSGGTILTEMSKGKFTERRENRSVTTARVSGTLFPSARTSLALGTEITRTSNAAMDGYSDTLAQGVSKPSTLIAGTRYGRNTTTGGWFLEPRLNLNSKFFVNPGFRIDGSGVTGSRGGFRGGLFSLFPKLNFSWIAIDREGEEPLWGIVSLLRPRVAFGIAGVQPGAEWSLRLLEQDVGGWDPMLSSDTVAPNRGLRLRSVGNTRLGPEKTQEVEGGFDLQLWDTRVTLSATGFYKMRKDAIQQLPLAPSIGALLWRSANSLSYYANIGHVRNTGGELTLNASVLDRPNIGWNIDVSISKYSNKLVKLFGEQSMIDMGDGTRLIEGYPLFSRWSRPISGWSDPKNGTKLWYGDYVVDSAAVYMGMQAPDFEMPFRTSLTLFRGLLSINGQFNYKAGLTQSNLGSRTLLSNIYENPNSTYGQQAYALAAACFNEQGAQAAYLNGIQCTDYGFIQRINSMRFNSASVGYNVPRAYLKRLPVSSLSVSLQGSNLGLWTNYRGKDPDVNGMLIGDGTRDSGQLPMPRTWSLQIRIGT